MEKAKLIQLPPPDIEGGMTLTETLAWRQSVRDFSPEPLTMSQVSQVLWAAQGFTDKTYQRRTIPSAGATYPLEVFLVCGDSCVEKLPAGIYYYDLKRHALMLTQSGEARRDLARAALGQGFIYEAPVDIVICAIYERTSGTYGARAERYVHMEAGHAGQNIYLQATALGLGTVAVGAFNDERVREALRLDREYKPLYIMPVGRPAQV
jgi:SagB-type dehydrogenase family enzyme